MKILFWCLVALNLTDFWLTALIIKNGGSEANPIVNWFIEQYGIFGIVLFKAPFLLILGYAIYFTWDKLSATFLKIVEPGICAIVGMYIILNLYSLGLYALMLHK